MREKDGGKEGFHRQESRVEDSDEKEKGSNGKVGRIRIGATLARRGAYWELEFCPSSPQSRLTLI